MVDYRPVGKGRKVVAVLRMVDGRPEREIRIRKYIRMLKAAKKCSTQDELKPLKNILREYLKVNPDYANVLRFKDAPRGFIHITDGRFILKQLSLDEAKEFLARDAFFADAVPYRQLARQTDNYRNFGSTEETRVRRSRLSLWLGSVREALNDHPAASIGATAALVVVAAVALIATQSGAKTFRPHVNYSDASEIDRMLNRHESALRSLPVMRLEDPEGARQTLKEIRLIAGEAQRQALSTEQTRRLVEVQKHLLELEAVLAQDNRKRR